MYSLSMHACVYGFVSKEPRDSAGLDLSDLDRRSTGGVSMSGQWS